MLTAGCSAECRTEMINDNDRRGGGEFVLLFSWKHLKSSSFCVLQLNRKLSRGDRKDKVYLIN